MPGVGAHVGVWANVTVVSDDGGASYGCSAVDGGAAAYGDIVCDGGSFFDGSVAIWFEVVENELISLQQVLGPTAYASVLLSELNA